MYARVLYSVSCLIIYSILPVYSQTCGYESCPKPKEDVINIHFVAHTHDDVGWLKTKDQYFYGQNMQIQEAGVQYILDSVIDALLADPNRRFIYVETAFFWMWWVEQSQDRRQVVKELVNSGRLEIIGGAWSMNDEAAAHYQSIVDQFTWGFRRLNESLGECATPKIGWQIDPFGHSRENAAIMAKLGFDGLFLGRIDYQDKITRHFNKAYETMWHTSENDLSDDSILFTSVMYNTYSPPPSFCFDVHCQDSPIVDNVKSPEYNVPERVSTFLNLMYEYSIPYRTNNVLVTMGNDFNYQYANMNFKNMDKLIRYINEYESYGSKFHAFYSTPSCYLKAVRDSGVNFPVKRDDYFPYASDEQSFWTGYFTSRPTQKRFERMGNNFLQVGKQIAALSALPSAVDFSAAKEAMGVMQHHDAITGTEKQHVSSDYARLLTEAMVTVEHAASQGLNVLVNKKILNRWQTSNDLKFNSCLLLNVSSCPLTENSKSFVITLYNPLSRSVDKLVRLPVAYSHLTYTVLDPEGNKVDVQLVPLPNFVNIPGRTSKVSFEIVFIAKGLPPLGFKSFFVEISQVKQSNFHTSEEVELTGSLKVGYENGITLSLNPSGSITSLRKNFPAKEVPFHQKFFYYRGAVGDNLVSSGGQRSSGAYIFRPNGTAVPIDTKPVTKIIKGPIITEIQQNYSDWISQVIRLHNGSDVVEFQWKVGPIPFVEGNGEASGKEVITRYTVTTIHNNEIFYTDSNGREMLQRKLNYRPDWHVELVEPISGNYYPITTRIKIEDKTDPTLTMSVVTDRSEGGSSFNDGQVELMLHRRLMHDDAFGVGEALNEMAFGEPLVAVGSHYVTLENDAKARMLVQEKVLDTWIFISETNGMSFDNWKKNNVMQFSGLKNALPDNVQILTLEPWSDEEDKKKIYILRLENIMEKRDDSTVAKIDIKDIFSTFSIANIKEMKLGANIPVEKSKRLKWRQFSNENVDYVNEDFKTGIINLKPMGIRTFLITIEPLLFTKYDHFVSRKHVQMVH